VDTSRSTQNVLTRRTALKAGAVTAGLIALGVGTGAAPASADTARGGSKQSGWRWCNRCQCLFYGDNYTSGWCEQGGGHNYGGSGNYTPSYGSGSEGQNGWRWCSKCQNMWWGGSQNKGRCSSGAGHSKDGSGDYHMAYGDPKHGEQPGWRWCNKCYCFCYGQSEGRCPKGGHHNYGGSGNYYLDYIH